MLSIQSDQEIRQTIRLYSPKYQPEQWSPVTVSPGFSGSIVLQYTAHAQKYAIHIESHKGQSASKLEAMTRLLEDARHRGISYVAPPIRQINGHVANFLSNGNLIHIEPWLPGTAETEIPFSAKKRDNAMQALATLHHVLAKHVPIPQHYSWLRSACVEKSPSLVFRLKKLERSLKNGFASIDRTVTVTEKISSFQNRLHSFFQVQAAGLYDKLHLAACQKLPLQPVFRDVWRDHILFTENEVTGIIDPAEFGTDSVLTDLTRLLGSIAGNNWQAWSKAITAYQTVRLLSEAEKKLIPVFDLSNLLLSAIGCFERYCQSIASPADFPAGICDRLSVRLEEYLCRLEFWETIKM